MKLMLAQNTAQQRAAARTEQQAQRRAAACKMPLPPAASRFSGPAGRMAGRPTPALTAKGQGESTPALRAIIYE